MSLRKLTLALTLAVLVLATLFLPCVKAYVQVSSEFVEPIRNGSFEEGSKYWNIAAVGWQSNTYALNDTSSWYTNGAWFLQQELGSVINVLKGKNVTFSFWFRPETVAQDGSKNYAHATLLWSTGGAPPPPSGCPFVFSWDGTQYVADNNILPTSEDQDRSEVDVKDFYRLEQHPVVKQGKYSLLIREFESEHSYIDEVKLSVVDHKSDVYIAVSSSGEVLTYKNPIPPVSAVSREGENVTEALSGTDGWFYEGYKGGYVTLNFGNLNISDGAKLLIISDKKVKSPVYIQTLNSTGDWNTVATIYARTHWSVDIVDLYPYLPNNSGELKVRLCFVSNDMIDFVGLDNTGQGKFEVQSAELVQAVHSVNGNVKKKLEESDGDYAEIPSGDQIRLEFTAPPTDEDSRDFVLYVKGHYVPHTGNPSASGVWVYPTELKWYNAYVNASLPSDLGTLYVNIEGKSCDFYAWVDVATLYIYNVEKTITSKGDLSVSAALVCWNKDLPGVSEPNDYAWVSVGLYAQGNPNYDPGGVPAELRGARIFAIKLKVELLPHDGTVQKAMLAVIYCGQGNDKDIPVDPAKVEEFHNEVLMPAEIAIDVIAGGAIGMVTSDPLLGIFLAGATESVITFVFQHFASDMDDGFANTWTNEGDYSIHECWVYPSGWIPDSTCFVSRGSGHYYFNWVVNAADPPPSGNFQICVTASVHWGYRQFSSLLGAYQLVDAGWQSASTYVTIYP